MTVPGALPPDLFTALAALFLLLGVPLILFVLIMLYTGYVRHDAEQFLEELESEGERAVERSETEHGTETEHSGENVSADEERAESATARDERRAERHSPATSEEGETEESEDESTDFVGGDESKSP